MEIGQFLLALIAIFIAAKLFGELAERIGQPAVLGELIGGIVVGVSGLHLVDAHNPSIHKLSELGVIFLLFLIGLETDLRKLLSVGGASAAVAAIGVAVPFGTGFAAGLLLGYGSTIAIFLGAALTATSVGITARVLSDLGQLKAKASQIVLGAAVIDDIIGLILLTVVGSIAAGEGLTVFGVSRVVLVAFGFVILAVVIGSLFAPWLVRVISRLRVEKALLFASIVFALGLAWIAQEVGSALIIGAFAAGLVLNRTERGHQIEKEVHDVAQFFVPIFFVSVGAAVDLRSINPFNPEALPFFLVGLLLSVIGIVGKLVAGLGAAGQGVSKMVVGVGMVPRGEVGLIFAQIGLSAGLLGAGLYSSVTMMVIVTTFITPPLLRKLLADIGDDGVDSSLQRVVNEAMDDD